MTGKVVFVSDSEVSDFNSKWPASNVPEIGIYFHFEGNGDLVDIETEDGRDSAEFDGPALLALSQDAQQGVIGEVQ